MPRARRGHRQTARRREAAEERPQRGLQPASGLGSGTAAPTAADSEPTHRRPHPPGTPARRSPARRPPCRHATPASPRRSFLALGAARRPLPGADPAQPHCRPAQAQWGKAAGAAGGLRGPGLDGETAAGRGPAGGRRRRGAGYVRVRARGAEPMEAAGWPRPPCSAGGPRGGTEPGGAEAALRGSGGDGRAEPLAPCLPVCAGLVLAAVLLRVLRWRHLPANPSGWGLLRTPRAEESLFVILFRGQILKEECQMVK